MIDYNKKRKEMRKYKKEDFTRESRRYRMLVEVNGPGVIERRTGLSTEESEDITAEIMDYADNLYLLAEQLCGDKK